MSSQIIRALAGLSFLIFLCPFFQMCSDENLMKGIKKEERTITENSPSEEEAALRADSEILDKENLINKEKIIEEDRKEVTLNAYELAANPFKDIHKYSIEDLADIQLYTFLCFTLIVLLSIFVFVYSLSKNYKKVLRLLLIILALSIFPLVIFYMENVLEDINQIKWGYYLFFINIIAIIYFARKANLKLVTHAI